MHIPSSRVYNQIHREEGGIWFVPANGGKETAVLIKAPTSALKALVAGAPLTFVFAIQDKYLCCGTRIYDVPGAPLLLCSIQRHNEEHATLRRIAAAGRSPIFLFNEMDVCVAWSDSMIANDEKAMLIDFLSIPEGFYSGKYPEAAPNFLDAVCEATNLQKRITSTEDFLAIETTVAHGPWASNMVSFPGIRDTQSIVIDDLNEGGVFESAIWASLESVFPFNLHRSPQVTIGKKQRELVDVTAFYEHGSFFIEAKDLSILASGFDRTRERRLAGIQKQAKKAIVQLTGACKAAKRGEKITDRHGNPILLNLNQPIHCIALLSDLMHEGDWKAIEKSLRDAVLETGDFYHILDLRELVTILKCSKGDQRLLDYNLMMRWEQFVKTGSVHIRSRPAPP
ncbi:hypothetical protein GJV26_18290 [Massilia dura]|uniref:Uncharacterized protein n=1 Tax=Pseudoduganella dura TaxID=321982 RepID=A0A6I3XIY8_9BURK|nr:hypothetical protein [Pseudoduganella dura]MUI14393.1 hypothetical protein [Pseudoduganella dura]GGY05589.1 hypothetical protein GCM10007386_40360 [Pseudoduganella dura]